MNRVPLSKPIASYSFPSSSDMDGCNFKHFYSKMYPKVVNSSKLDSTSVQSQLNKCSGDYTVSLLLDNIKNQVNNFHQRTLDVLGKNIDPRHFDSSLVQVEYPFTSLNSLVTGNTSKSNECLADYKMSGSQCYVSLIKKNEEPKSKGNIYIGNNHQKSSDYKISLKDDQFDYVDRPMLSLSSKTALPIWNELNEINCMRDSDLIHSSNSNTYNTNHSYFQRLNFLKECIPEKHNSSISYLDNMKSYPTKNRKTSDIMKTNVSLPTSNPLMRAEVNTNISISSNPENIYYDEDSSVHLGVSPNYMSRSRLVQLSSQHKNRIKRIHGHQDSELYSSIELSSIDCQVSNHYSDTKLTIKSCSCGTDLDNCQTVINYKNNNICISRNSFDKLSKVSTSTCFCQTISPVSVKFYLDFKNDEVKPEIIKRYNLGKKGKSKSDVRKNLIDETGGVSILEDIKEASNHRIPLHNDSNKKYQINNKQWSLQGKNLKSLTPYKGPECTPPFTQSRLYGTVDPVSFPEFPIDGYYHAKAEYRVWSTRHDIIISQNSSKRKVHKGVWLSPLYPSVAFPVAVKFVEDRNSRDGRSIKREIECHLYIHQRLSHIQKENGYSRTEDAWPSSELFGYYLDNENPGNSIMITRKLSGPDFFDVIREENNGSLKLDIFYEYHKLQWCLLALKRIQQYGQLGIRHNDVKPDNIVLDYYNTPSGNRSLDVKIIDLGTASMHSSKEFTGGTSWYESPEQKILEYYSKKIRDSEAAKQVDIGLASDIWATGLSITEVLVGKRVVDTLKPPNGPGPLEYLGPVKGWSLSPEKWVEKARKALLQGPNESYKYNLCFETAKYIFDVMVKPKSYERGSLQDVIENVKKQSEKALRYTQQQRN